MVNSQPVRIVLAQGAVTGLMAGLIALFDTTAAVSGLAGGLIATLSNGVFAVAVFGPYRAQEPQTLVGRFYAAEVIKLALAVTLFFAAFKLIEPLNGLALFGVFFAAQMVPVFLYLGR